MRTQTHTYANTKSKKRKKEGRILENSSRFIEFCENLKSSLFPRKFIMFSVFRKCHPLRGICCVTFSRVGKLGIFRLKSPLLAHLVDIQSILAIFSDLTS